LPYICLIVVLWAILVLPQRHASHTRRQAVSLKIGVSLAPAFHSGVDVVEVKLMP